MSTKIRLHWRTISQPDGSAPERSMRIIRLSALVSFKGDDDWIRPMEALIDTGGPFILLPQKIWKNIQIDEYLSESTVLGGVGKGRLQARLAKVRMAFLSTQKDIFELNIRAYLAEDDTVPLLLGVEDLLTKARLVCD